MNLLSLASAFAAAIALAQGATGGILTPVSSDRFVSVLNRESAPPTTVSFTGPMLGQWQASAFKTNNDFNDPNYNPFGSPTAVTSTQNSNFSASGVSFSGFVFIDYTGIMPPNNGATATNRCYATFHIDTICNYQLNTTMTFLNAFPMSGTVSLLQSGSPLFTQSNSGNLSGTLTPGDYELRILMNTATGGNIAFDTRTQIDTTFSVPTPTSALSLALPGFALAHRRRRRAA